MANDNPNVSADLFMCPELEALKKVTLKGLMMILSASHSLSKFLNAQRKPDNLMILNVKLLQKSRLMGELFL